MNETFHLTATAIIKDEAAYIEEWLTYHILIGFEHFYIFDNGSTDTTAKVLEPYIKYGYVTYIYWPVFPGQFDAYGYAIKIFGPHSKWMAFFDIDEFFVLKQHESLPALLDTVDADQLLVSWRFYGHSGHRSKPDGLVIENYTGCDPDLAPVVKCIVRPSKAYVMFVHNCSTTSGKTVNDTGLVIKEDWMLPTEHRSEQFVCMNHYFTRSYEEYEQKIHRGQVDGRTQKKVEPFEKWDYPHHDTCLVGWTEKVRDLISWFRNLPVQPYRYGSLTPIGIFSNCRNFTLLSQEMVRELEVTLPSAGMASQLYFGTSLQLPNSVSAEEVVPSVDKIIDTYLQKIGAESLFHLTAETMGNIRLANSDLLSDGLPLVFDARNADPYISASVQPPGTTGYIICMFLVRVPEDTNMDLFTFAKDLLGEELRATRRVNVSKGLLFGAYMVNDLPMAPEIVRCDPGSVAGRYEVMRMSFAIVR